MLNTAKLLKVDITNNLLCANFLFCILVLFQAFKPTGDARIYCTFLGDVLKMYNKVKKRFEGHLCHAVVIGSPIFLKKNKVHLSSNIKSIGYTKNYKFEESLS